VKIGRRKVALQLFLSSVSDRAGDSLHSTWNSVWKYIFASGLNMVEEFSTKSSNSGKSRFLIFGVIFHEHRRAIQFSLSRSHRQTWLNVLRNRNKILGYLSDVHDIKLLAHCFPTFGDLVENSSTIFNLLANIYFQKLFHVECRESPALSDALERKICRATFLRSIFTF
jgi:hypothetical protein